MHRTKRDIERDQADNDLRFTIIAIYKKYKELDISDVLFVLGSRVRSETEMFIRHYNVQAKEDAINKKKEPYYYGKVIRNNCKL